MKTLRNIAALTIAAAGIVAPLHAAAKTPDTVSCSVVLDYSINREQFDKGFKRMVTTVTRIRQREQAIARAQVDGPVAGRPWGRCRVHAARRLVRDDSGELAAMAPSRRRIDATRRRDAVTAGGGALSAPSIAEGTPACARPGTDVARRSHDSSSTSDG